MILDSLHWNAFSSRFYKFALAEIILYQLTQFGFLVVSSGIIFGKVGPAVMVYFW